MKKIITVMLLAISGVAYAGDSVEKCQAFWAPVIPHHPEGKYQYDLCSKQGVKIGMTTGQVLNNSSWGKPKNINSTTNSKYTFEQWVYGHGHYLYFTNGKVSSIQTRG